MRRVPKRSQYVLQFILPLLAMILLLRRFDVTSVADLLRRACVYKLILGYLVFEGAILLRMLRWHSITRRAGIDSCLLRSLIVFRIGWFTGTFLPQGWGSLSKVLYLRKDGHRTALSTGCVIVERLLDLSTLIVYGLLGAAYLAPRLAIKGTLQLQYSSMGFILAIVGVLCVVALLLLTWPRDSRAVSAINAFLPLLGLADKMVDVVRSFRRLGTLYLVQLVAGSFVIWLTHALSVYLLLQSLGVQIAYDQALAAFALSGFAVALPISIDGVGAREATLVAAFVSSGYSGEAALAWGMLISFESLFSRIIGAPLMIKYPLPL